MWQFPNRNNDILNIIVADVCVITNVFLLAVE